MTTILIWSCNEDIIPGEDGDTDTTSIIKDYLDLINPVKITGDFPDAMQTDLKINYKDTLYVIKDNSYKARVVVLHDEGIDITGFYVWINGMAGSSYYYDVPRDAAEGSDSTTVIYIGLDPDEDEVSFPYTVPVTIVPHDASGVGIKKIERHITCEMPGDGDCEIYNDDGSAWIWRFTQRYNYQGNLAEVRSPYAIDINVGDRVSFKGCCNSGIYVPYGEPMGADGYCEEDDETGSQFLRTVFYKTGYFNMYDYLFLFKSRAFVHYSGDATRNFNPSESICANETVYNYKDGDFTKTGTHDYSPGDGDIRLTTEVSDPPFGPVPPFGKIVFTCHTLIFEMGFEDKIYKVYQRYPDVDSNEPPKMSDLKLWFD